MSDLIRIEVSESAGPGFEKRVEEMRKAGYLATFNDKLALTDEGQANRAYVMGYLTGEAED